MTILATRLLHRNLLKLCNLFVGNLTNLKPGMTSDERRGDSSLERLLVRIWRAGGIIRGVAQRGDMWRLIWHGLEQSQIVAQRRRNGRVAVKPERTWCDAVCTANRHRNSGLEWLFGRRRLSCRRNLGFLWRRGLRP